VGTANTRGSIQGRRLFSHYLGSWQQQPSAAHTKHMPGRVKTAHYSVLVRSTLQCLSLVSREN